MAIQIQKKVRVESQFDMIKLQLLLYTFFKKIYVSDTELECAAFLALHKFNKNFFKDAVTFGIFSSEQAVRNCLSKLKRVSIAIKDKKDWKINPEIAIGIDSKILLDLKAMNIK